MRTAIGGFWREATEHVFPRDDEYKRVSLLMYIFWRALDANKCAAFRARVSEQEKKRKKKAGTWVSSIIDHRDQNLLFY